MIKFTLNKTAPREVTRALVFFEGQLEKATSFASLPLLEKMRLEAYIKQLKLTGEYSTLHALSSGEVILLFSLGKAEKFTLRTYILAARRLVQQAKANNISTFTLDARDLSRSKISPAVLGHHLALQAELANFEFRKYKTAPREGWRDISEIYVSGANAAFKKGVSEGLAIGEEVNSARQLSNIAGADMTPAVLAGAAVAVGKKHGIQTKILDEKEMGVLGMGAVLGVAKGSAEPPKFIIMEYMRGKKGERPVVLVGKGVTFDTGGLNLKPSSSIYEMHMDMSGGAAVIHTISALARLGVKKNIVGLIPAVENAISGSSYRPGDVLTTMGGKTIEVMDTDAEGRVILADALCYATTKYSPSLVIDIATLTGAALVALGQRASAVFSNSDTVSRALIKAAEGAGDYMWPLPLWEEFEVDIKGTFGDVANIGKTRWGGAITGAVFLWQFVKGSSSDARGRSETRGVSWVHIDMAPRMTTIDGEYLAKGAAGAPVAALVKFLMG